MSTCSPRLPAAVCFGILTVGLSLTALSGCRHAEEGTDPTSQRAGQDTVRIQPPGCLELRLTAQGGERDSLRAWLPAGSLPSVVELDTTRAASTGGDSVYTAYSWFDGRRESHPFSVWRRTEGEAIRVQRAGALAGTMLDLRPGEGALSGTVTVYRDAGMRGTPTRREGALEAVPVRCPDA